MAVSSLRTHLVEELIDLLDAENQLTKALPKMAAASTTAVLRTAFGTHLKETRGQIVRLNRALRQMGETPRRKTCEGMEGLIAEGEEVMNQTPPGAVRDAVMITSAQKVEHYEMASYGTARTYAEVLGEAIVAQLLAQSLKEEKAADGKLTMIAENSVNEDAAEEWRSQEEDGLIERTAEWMEGRIRKTSRQLAGRVRQGAVAVGLANDRSSTSRRGRASGRKRAAHSRSKSR